MKGIILAGGHGTRLRPLTTVVSKQLLPAYDKPMIYHPLSTLMLAGIREVLIISTPTDLPNFRRLLRDGSHLGISIDYAQQTYPGGLAEAFIIGADHIGDDAVGLILGDNIFHGRGFSHTLKTEIRSVQDGDVDCVLFGYSVSDPERYGVGMVDNHGELTALEEKPADPQSDRAITGLYLYANGVVEIVRSLAPSARGELEIIDINRTYLERRRVRLVDLGRGFAWLDTGTYESLLEAGNYMRVLEYRQSVRIACVEEVAMRMGYISPLDCLKLGEKLDASSYGTTSRTSRRWHWNPHPARDDATGDFFSTATFPVDAAEPVAVPAADGHPSAITTIPTEPIGSIPRPAHLQSWPGSPSASCRSRSWRPTGLRPAGVHPGPRADPAAHRA